VDGSREFLSGEEKKPATKVLYHERNMGKGAAIRTGLTAASGDIIIVQDADLEYEPAEIPSVIAPILSGETDVCYGSRFLGEVKRMALPNRVANAILAKTVSLLYGQRITDEATAYKAFRRSVLASIKLECTGFEFCPEVTAKVLRSGHSIKEVPVSFVARTHQEGKKIGWRDFFIAMHMLLKIRFRKSGKAGENG
jgi:glycosyltransferase involved in cell wall biosynthesis